MAKNPGDPFNASQYDPTTVAGLSRFKKLVEMAKLRIADDTATQEQVREFAELSMSHPAYWGIVVRLIPAMRLLPDAPVPPDCSGRMVDLLNVTRSHRIRHNWTVVSHDPADVKGLVRGMIGEHVNKYFASLDPFPDTTSQAVADQIRDGITWLLQDPKTRGPPPLSVMPNASLPTTKKPLSTEVDGDKDQTPPAKTTEQSSGAADGDKDTLGQDRGSGRSTDLVRHPSGDDSEIAENSSASDYELSVPAGSPTAPGASTIATTAIAPMTPVYRTSARFSLFGTHGPSVAPLTTTATMNPVYRSSGSFNLFGGGGVSGSGGSSYSPGEPTSSDREAEESSATSSPERRK